MRRGRRPEEEEGGVEAKRRGEGKEQEGEGGRRKERQGKRERKEEGRRRGRRRRRGKSRDTPKNTYNHSHRLRDKYVLIHFAKLYRFLYGLSYIFD